MARNRRSPPELSQITGAVQSPVPAQLEVQLATLAAEAPEGDGWLHETKFDGYRMLARIESGQAAIISRNGKDWTRKFPELAQLLPSLPVREAVLDGEICYMLPDHVTGFGELHAAIGDKKTASLVYFIFDLIYLDGYRLDGAGLLDRKALLARILESPPDDRLRYSEHQIGGGPEFFAAAAATAGLEGIVSKKTDARYWPGRSTNWLKVKAHQREEFIVLGWTDPDGARLGFGRLVLGYYSKSTGQLTYAGGVGTGFNDKLLVQLHKRLLTMPAPDTHIVLPAGVRRSSIHWVRPEVVVQVRFGEWTRDGILRHSAFLGERLDKTALEVVLDRTMRPDAKQYQWPRWNRRR